MRQPPRESAERRFERVFPHLPALIAYARRRGSGDPEGLAAETMAAAWAKLADLPPDDPRPWLFATARNLLRQEWRRRAARPERPLDPERDDPRGRRARAGRARPSPAPWRRSRPTTASCCS